VYKRQAITINHENMSENEVKKEAEKIKRKHKIPAFDVIISGGEGLAEYIIKESESLSNKKRD
jgi:uncharacterized NAD-dependent epimerase/dehydratase family protein